MRQIRRVTGCAFCLVLIGYCARPPRLEAMCGYAPPPGNSYVNQPSQRAFINWLPDERIEQVTVQPVFTGNAADFGMVIPTPSQPKLDEMPRDFFAALETFTILKPLDRKRFPPAIQRQGLSDLPRFDLNSSNADPRTSSVRILDAGIVGALDYKIIQAGRGEDLYQWLTANKYEITGDRATLQDYIRHKWFFTTMKIDSKQMKKRDDGTYDGQITPTRFAFTSDTLVYPLKITQSSVADRTEALFYVQAPSKMDMATPFSFQPYWQPMWYRSMNLAFDGKLTPAERDWRKHIDRFSDIYEKEATVLKSGGHGEADLLWAKRLGADDLAFITGDRPFDREAKPEDVARLKLLQGHLKKGAFLTKIGKVFYRKEMKQDAEFNRAYVDQRPDDSEYTELLPTSP